MPETPTAGTILVAPPMLQDPNFRRTVVLVCENNPEGSLGLILNRPLDMRLGEVLDELAASSEPLALGGPVQTNTLHYIHRLGNEIPGSIEIADEVHWGGDFTVVKNLVRGEALSSDDFRFFVGYAGWSPGQLEEEIAEDGWIIAEAHSANIFSDVPENLWRDTLRRMGGQYALIANFPDNPRLN